MIISNHANPPPCFLEQFGEVPFVDMVFMHEIEVNKLFGCVSHLQPGADKNQGVICAKSVMSKRKGGADNVMVV